jgi:hypothetical protein
MREFTDRDGAAWTATVRSADGPDYKGRHYFVLRAADAEEVELADVRWNSERTARRTLDTMSLAELRRRLRSAVGRASTPVST